MPQKFDRKVQQKLVDFLKNNEKFSHCSLVALKMLIDWLPKTLEQLQNALLSLSIAKDYSCELLHLMAIAVLKIAEMGLNTTEWLHCFHEKCQVFLFLF